MYYKALGERYEHANSRKQSVVVVAGVVVLVADQEEDLGRR